MFTIAYHYRVPPDAERAYLALQQRVAQLYLDAGCLRYSILKPAQAGGEWMDLSTFESREAFERVEQILGEEDRLGALFAEFLRITRQSEDDIRVSEWEDMLVLEGAVR